MKLLVKGEEVLLDRERMAESYFLALKAQQKANPIGFIPPNLSQVAAAIHSGQDTTRQVVARLITVGKVQRVETARGHVKYLPVQEAVQ